VPAGRLELPALVFHLMEEPGVLNGEGGLGGEGAEQLDDLRRKLARCLAGDAQDADDLVLAHQGHAEQRPVSGVDQRVANGTLVGTLHRDVGDLDRLP
jgi:hypothetical protein